MKKPIMTIRHTGRNGYITLNRYAIITLGMPEYVCMLMGSDNKSLAFVPCPEKHVMSFKVPENYSSSRHTEFKICSKGFVDRLVEVNNLEGKMSHNIEGIYDKDKNMIVFPIKVACGI